ncbi:hypothetical protein [Amycolatopsis sp. DSM 110486]|uniref:hypothetical protein n=1 Tax=Amycolatopsis sp. DSM 110486 TaxID=2865832 RepID=UPI001C69ECF9|nr:hypothetical protein [Amycolatopsis sp. DSM 110486]QYN17594.1 hypothetical protein K1T34_32945 [Amycolatopsis sp. DSM 110486]
MSERLTGPYEGDPWERQPGETEKQFGRFTVYIETPAGQRSFAAIARAHDVERSTIQTVAEAFRWRDRAALYDNHRNKVRRDAVMQRDIALAERVMVLAEAAAGVLQRTIGAVLSSGEPLDPKLAPAWAKMLETFRDIALNRPDQIIEVAAVNGGGEIRELEGLSPEQRRDRVSEMARSVLRVIEGGKAS